ncbi:MAG TPA: hypothetical protein VGO14_02715 [Solirubrobacteraceae bacterium]|nr:hypothetical protein [Solirubrobacteraceae bacterium]
MHAFQSAHRSARWWLAATLGAAALSLGTAAIAHGEESNPNNDTCLGHLSAGHAELGSDEQQVQYTFLCNGAITGYQVQSQIPVTGIQSPPTVTDLLLKPLNDSFSCSGDIPGFAANCVGAAKTPDEWITGQFAIGSKLCAEPRVDALLTVTYAYLEKGAIVQAISGPFELGRPQGCPASTLSGGTRLNPTKPIVSKRHKAKKSPKKSHKKAAHKATRHTR